MHQIIPAAILSRVTASFSSIIVSPSFYRRINISFEKIIGNEQLLFDIIIPMFAENTILTVLCLKKNWAEVLCFDRSIKLIKNSSSTT